MRSIFTSLERISALWRLLSRRSILCFAITSPTTSCSLPLREYVNANRSIGLRPSQSTTYLHSLSTADQNAGGQKVQLKLLRRKIKTPQERRKGFLSKQGHSKE